MIATRSPAKSKATAATEQRQVRTKSILYPEFLQASEFEDDPYWKKALVDASHGNFSSKMTVYVDGRLMRKDSTTSSVRVPRNNPESVANIFVRFSKKYDRILSNQELKNQVSKRYEVCSRQVILTWNVASLPMKRAALNHYATRICNSMHFDSEVSRYRSARDLSSTLLVAMGTKMLTKDTVQMDNNIIVDVKCVRYNKEHNSWILVHPPSKNR